MNNTFAITEKDIAFLKRVNQLALEAIEEGNMPFAAILVSPNGDDLLEIKNREGATHDRTDHAERVLAGEASKSYSAEYLARCTLYTNFEPCAMCSGAIYWSGIGKVVYSLSEKELLEMTGDDERNPTMSMPCRDVLNCGQRKIEVIGPVKELAEETAAVHKNFW